MGLCNVLEENPKAKFHVPRAVELAVQDAKVARILEVQSARAVLARIAELHMVERVEELRVEGGPDALVDSRGLGKGKVQVPPMLAVERTKIVGPAINAQN